jgi:hypothetical protein
MSVGEKLGILIISKSFLKLFCDFCMSWLQYHSPSRKELSFGYGSKVALLRAPSLGEQTAMLESILRSIFASGSWMGMPPVV